MDIPLLPSVVEAEEDGGGVAGGGQKKKARGGGGGKGKAKAKEGTNEGGRK